ncbi:hypothetical protein CEXT_491791 [Caerostris extrusa]|uniref:Uncharacterized protein n=1 Tax=Caerostris extrusa TaxID=172846 RepID=A0AAV4S940_CAEEX|nr:hypothetical protein CEXT_491791 [Caerostris extrusa]
MPPPGLELEACCTSANVEEEEESKVFIKAKVKLKFQTQGRELDGEKYHVPPLCCKKYGRNKNQENKEEKIVSAGKEPLLTDACAPKGFPPIISGVDGSRIDNCRAGIESLDEKVGPCI